MESRLKNGIMQILIVNIFNLLINLITNFIMPKYLSVETYAMIKSYQLYINYAGILHLGFVDGIYLKYGGKNYHDIEQNTYNTELNTLRNFQFVVSVIVSIIAYLIHDIALLIAAISVMPYNMLSCYKMIMQATGEFKKFSNNVRALTFLTFVLNFGILFAFNSDNYIIYLIGYLVIYIILWLQLEYEHLKKENSNKFQWIGFDVEVLIRNIKNGVLLTLGNFSSLLLTGMDRWFVKILLSTVNFAQYSFAVSVESFLSFAINPITTTLYNYFCVEHSTQQIKKIRNMVIMFASMLIAAAFPAKFILEVFLTEYFKANTVVFILFTAQLFFVVIKSVYINLYKSRKQQKKYFLKLCIVIISGFVFNSICYMVMKNKESFAIGTLLASIFWFILCLLDFRDITIGIGEIFYMTFASICFLFVGLRLSALDGCIIYILFVITIGFIFLRSEYLTLFRMFKNMVLSLNRKRKE